MDDIIIMSTQVIAHAWHGSVRAWIHTVLYMRAAELAATRVMRRRMYDCVCSSKQARVTGGRGERGREREKKTREKN